MRRVVIHRWAWHRWNRNRSRSTQLQSCISAGSIIKMLVPDTVSMASFPGPHQSTSPRPAGVPRGSAALQLSTIDGGMLSQTAPGERQATTCDSAVAILSPRDTTQGDCHAQAADSRDASDASSPIGGALLKRKLEIQSERQYQRSFALPSSPIVHSGIGPSAVLADPGYALESWAGSLFSGHVPQPAALDLHTDQAHWDLPSLSSGPSSPGSLASSLCLSSTRSMHDSISPAVTPASILRR